MLVIGDSKFVNNIHYVDGIAKIPMTLIGQFTHSIDTIQDDFSGDEFDRLILAKCCALHDELRTSDYHNIDYAGKDSRYSKYIGYSYDHVWDEYENHHIYPQEIQIFVDRKDYSYRVFYGHDGWLV